MSRIDIELDRSTRGEGKVLSVTGDVDLFTAPHLRQAITEMLEEGAKLITVDLSRVGFLDSTGLGVLVGSLKRVREEGGELVLVGPQAPVARVLSVTGLDKVFSVYTDVAEALLSQGDGDDGPGRIHDASAS